MGALAIITGLLRRAMHTSFRPQASVLCCLSMGLCACTAPLAGTQQQVVVSTSASTVTTITLERDCFGCPSASALVLHRDGSAVQTQTGKARHGTSDKVSTGKVDTQDFDRLARLAVAQGFFDLKDEYDSEGLRDGAWTTTTISRGGQDKRIFRREDAGPAALRAIETAIEDLRARTRFTP